VMSDNRKRSYEDEGHYQFKKERRSGKVIKVLCPYYCTGAVIGTKGAAINQIKEESNTNIQVSKGAARFPRTDERVIAVSGELDGLMKVIAFVQDKIRTEKPSPQAKGVKFDRVDARKRICKIVVSDSSIGKLIGKGGANVNKLKDDNNVKIHMMKPADAIPGLNERVVTVEGEDKDVDKCIAEMVADVFENERGGLDYNLDYSQFQEGFNQGQGWNNRDNSDGNQYSGYGKPAPGGGYGGSYSNQGGSYPSQGGSYDNQGAGYGSNAVGYGGYNNQSAGGGYTPSGYPTQNPPPAAGAYGSQMYSQPPAGPYSTPSAPYSNQGFGSEYGGGYSQPPVSYSDNPGQGHSGYNANASYGHQPSSQPHYGTY